MSWSTADALTYAHHLIDSPIDPNKSGTSRLARAYIELHDELQSSRAAIREFAKAVDAVDQPINLKWWAEYLSSWSKS